MTKKIDRISVYGHPDTKPVSLGNRFEFKDKPKGTTNFCPICEANAKELEQLRAKLKQYERVVEKANIIVNQTKEFNRWTNITTLPKNIYELDQALAGLPREGE
jgi:hypothetical protein